ncbi:helix-turn-helix domain-containing protein [Aquitalea magnusonii]|jgi:transcriptional regulator with XRE-family HTH domain|uniref:helix-turn-helix domain-containing protein n=1 Tax=Aquitalea magnusonii TaxID=332411 RepID=UPI0009E910DF|nr:helix-turn-helix transcriptional regulator [Aquitalea magnusonii]
MIQAMSHHPLPFATRLARLMSGYRNGIGISDRALARAIGVSKQTVSNWLRGGVVPQRQHFQALAGFFGVSEWWLEHGEVLLDTEWPVRVRGVAERLSSLSPNRLEILEKLLEDWSGK